MIKIVLFASLAPAAAALASSVSLTELAPAYAQDFNGLASKTTIDHTWTNNVTLSGWYSSRTYYRARDGSVNLGGLYSYGTNGSSDRALGSSPESSIESIAWGVLLTNGGTTAIESLAINYVGEQWRNGSGQTNPQSLVFSYSTSATNVQTSSDFAGTVASLNFTSPITGSSVLALDGNASPNRTTRSGLISGLSLLPTQSVFLQWRDVNDPGTEHGLAVDDLSVTAQFATAAVPLPAAAWAGIVLFGVLGGAKLRRRRKADAV